MPQARRTWSDGFHRGREHVVGLGGKPRCQLGIVQHLDAREVRDRICRSTPTLSIWAMRRRRYRAGDRAPIRFQALARGCLPHFREAGLDVAARQRGLPSLDDVGRYERLFDRDAPNGHEPTFQISIRLSEGQTESRPCTFDKTPDCSILCRT